MATADTQAPLIRFVRRIASGPQPAPQDSALLERFVRQGDHAAFAALVARHGPLVLAACRRVLRDGHAAEDCFQATFLVLARKAAGLRRPDPLGPWLYGVAVRTALKARAQAARRSRKEREAAVSEAVEPPDEPALRDLRAALDEALHGLPEKYRTPLVLHYLEGRTVPEVARELGWPEGTAAARLARGRDRLRARLARRRLAPAAALLGALSGPAARAEFPVGLAATTVRAIGALTAAETAAGAVPASIAALAEGVLEAMWMTRLKAVGSCLLLLGLLGTGAGALTCGALRASGERPR